MDEQEKPFDTVSIVILMILAVANDIAEIISDLFAATIVGIVGEAIMEPVDFAVDGIVTFWFFMKCGFGGPAMAQILDDVLESIGIPGRTICVGFGIYIANHPNSSIGKIGQTAAALETGGESGALSEGLQEGEAAAKEAESAVETAAKTEKGATAEMEAGQATEKSGEPGGGEAKKEKEQEEEKKMEPEEEKEPEEVAKEKLFEETPMDSGVKNKEEEEENPGVDDRSNEAPRPSNVISIEDIRRNPRAEAVKRNLDHSAPPRNITADSTTHDDTSENSEMEEAA